MQLGVDPSLWETALRLGLAALFGLGVGLDRELRGKPAGLRTHMLVALGAATITVAALDLYHALVAANPNLRGDPLRVVDGVMAGVGFLGAGAILRDGLTVRGMTTAADIWVCGAIGLACGAGLFGVAAISLGLTIAIVSGLGFLAQRLRPPGDE